MIPSGIYTVNVTQDQINAGVRHDCERCVIAVALHTFIAQHSDHATSVSYVSIPEASAVSIIATDGDTELEIYPEDESDVENYIIDFDHGDAIKPMSFRVIAINTKPHAGIEY